jgi:hypothetical protein
VAELGDAGDDVIAEEATRRVTGEEVEERRQLHEECSTSSQSWSRAVVYTWSTGEDLEVRCSGITYKPRESDISGIHCELIESSCTGIKKTREDRILDKKSYIYTAGTSSNASRL